MIALEFYETQIGRHDLFNLLFGERFDRESDSEPSSENLTDPVEKAEKSAQSIIEQRFGYLPEEGAFLQTATIAGVIYLLSRKPHNQIDTEVIDQRRQTFFDMLPGQTGAKGRAETLSYVPKLGDWL